MSQQIPILPNAFRVLPMMLLLLQLAGGTALAGTLAVGEPQISGNQYTFPILLDSASNDVAVMDFHFQYDPQVFRPVEALSGSQADFSNKIVNANQASPGEYIVVLWGPNQATLNSGEVARIVMEYTGAETPNTQLGIGGLTMANADGVEVASQTRNLDMQLGSPTDTPPEGTLPPTNKPETPQDTDPASPEPNLVTGLGDPELAMGTNENDPKNDEQTQASQGVNSAISQFAKKSKEITAEERLALLAEDARNLRETLPTPEVSQAQPDAPSKAKLDVSKKNGIISASSGVADTGVTAASSDAAVGQLARAGGIVNGESVLSDEQVFGAENQTFRNVLFLICGGVLIGMVLYLFLRKKFFA